MKILVQIPCLNEEASLLDVIESIPSKIPGCSVDILVIDDGSTDATSELANRAGVSYIVKKSRTLGLAHSFKVGQAFFLASGHDILVNTDGDNQYFQQKIPALLAPIMSGEADIVIGNRKPGELEHFTPAKRLLQRLGSRIVSFVAGTPIPDAASGFRAYSRLAVANIFITTRFSYAMESIIQAGNKGLRIESVETGARKVTRPSRLFKSSFEHMRRSGAAILKGLLMYRPVKVFSWLALALFVAGLVPMVRYLVLIVAGIAGEHLQSLLLGSLLITASVLSLVLGLVAELSRIHRAIYEEEKALDRLTRKLTVDAALAGFSASLVNRPRRTR